MSTAYPMIINVVALTAAMLLAGCASAPPAGEDADGLGGTGILSANENGDGIGGTGFVADGIGGTGIIGVISELGSITINGVHIELPDNTPVSADGRSAGIDVLRVGQVVAALLIRRDQQLIAQEVSLNHPLIGPVSAEFEPGRALEIFGQSVVIEPTTVFDFQIDQLEAGERIRVSGYRTPDSTVVATRIERASAEQPNQISGVVEFVAGRDFRVGLITVRGQVGESPNVGSTVVAAVETRNGRLVATALEMQSSVPFPKRAQRYFVEGYALATSSSQLQLGQVEMTLGEAPRRVADAAFNKTPQRVRALVRVETGRRFVVERVVLARPTALERPIDRPAAARPSASDKQRPDLPAVPKRPHVPAVPTRPAIERPIVARPAVARPARPARPTLPDPPSARDIPRIRLERPIATDRVRRLP